MIEFETYDYYKKSIEYRFSETALGSRAGFDYPRLLNYTLSQLGSEEDFNQQINALKHFYKILFENKDLYIKSIERRVVTDYTVNLSSGDIKIQLNFDKLKIKSIYFNLRDEVFDLFIQKNLKGDYPQELKLDFLKGYFKENVTRCDIFKKLKEDSNIQNLYFFSKDFIDSFETFISFVHPARKYNSNICKEVEGLNTNKLPEFYDINSLKYDISFNVSNQRKGNKNGI